MILLTLNLDASDKVRVYWLEVEDTPGATDLTVQAAVHAHLADNVGLTGGIVLAANSVLAWLRRRRRR